MYNSIKSVDANQIDQQKGAALSVDDDGVKLKKVRRSSFF